MPEREIKVFESPDELGREAARSFREAAAAAEPGKIFSVALSGGSTPRKMLELLAQPDSDVPWERVQIFQVDERAVPPDHAQSNYRMIRGALLSHVPALEERNFHRMAAEQPDLESAAEDYARTLERVLGTAARQCPRLDLIFLGMGADGHTASLFPASPALEETRHWVRPNSSPHVSLPRLTLTYPILNAASEVIFLVVGEDKAQMVQAVLEGPSRPRELPAQGVHPADGRVSWYLDHAAAGRLRNQPRSTP
jgi:6-phosphogluconolactonase